MVSLDRAYTNDDGDEGKIDIVEMNLNPEQAYMKEQRKEEMRRIVDQLKPKYRQLVEMRYFDEKSYDEIASELDLPLGTVKAQLFRARELMHEILKHSVNNI